MTDACPTCGSNTPEMRKHQHQDGTHSWMHHDVFPAVYNHDQDTVYCTDAFHDAASTALHPTGESISELLSKTSPATPEMNAAAEAALAKNASIFTTPDSHDHHDRSQADSLASERGGATSTGGDNG